MQNVRVQVELAVQDMARQGLCDPLGVEDPITVTLGEHVSLHFPLVAARSFWLARRSLGAGVLFSNADPYTQLRSNESAFFYPSLSRDSSTMFECHLLSVGEAHEKMFSRQTACLVYSWAWLTRDKPELEGQAFFPWGVTTVNKNSEKGKRVFKYTAEARKTRRRNKQSLFVLIEMAINSNSPRKSNPVRHMTYILEMLVAALALIIGTTQALFFLEEIIANFNTICNRCEGPHERRPTPLDILKILVCISEHTKSVFAW
jgi:hypothetical protein